MSGERAAILRGRPLRYLLVTILADARGPLTVPELIARCQREGVVFDGRASKIISDALRWERRSGRVTHVARGVYVIGRVPASTGRWIARRVEQVRWWLESVVGQEEPDPVEARALTQLWTARQRNTWVPGWPFWPFWSLP